MHGGGGSCKVTKILRQLRYNHIVYTCPNANLADITVKANKITMKNKEKTASYYLCVQEKKAMWNYRISSN